MRRKKERGRPSDNPLPPRTTVTPEQLARAMFNLPANHEWQYTTNPPVYQCARCQRTISYPEILPDNGICKRC